MSYLSLRFQILVQPTEIRNKAGILWKKNLTILLDFSWAILQNFSSWTIRFTKTSILPNFCQVPNLFFIYNFKLYHSRMEVLQLYSNNLQYNTLLCWDAGTLGWMTCQPSDQKVTPFFKDTKIRIKSFKFPKYKRKNNAWNVRRLVNKTFSNPANQRIIL